MPPHQCEICKITRAQVLRPKNGQRICSACFIALFESEVAVTITSTNLFQPGERVAIGASGGKDSTVLASVLKTLNDRHGWNLDLVLLSVDEGIQGYRDHSLEAVKRNSADLDLPLKIVSYEELYGWSMDQVVAQVGKKGNCTYCGVFRRQALDRGAAMLNVGHVVTGHNADDVAETVLMNLLRGDLPRLSRATSIITSTPSAAPPKDDGAVSFTNVKRSKPLMYAYEKEIVLYAHHKKLDYFSTECIYSPEAFRGSARTLIKNLERIRPESILDVVRSGVDMAKLVPGADGKCKGACGDSKAAGSTNAAEEEAEGGCGSSNTNSGGDSMVEMEKKLQQDERTEANGPETEVTLPANPKETVSIGVRHSHEAYSSLPPDDGIYGQNHEKNGASKATAVPIRTKQEKKSGRKPTRDAAAPKQRLGQCERCGYLSSQSVCKACVLLEGLNKARPRTGVEVGGGG
ncbi:cytosolic thiouridylase subunit Ctu1 [Saxophila tyrrhenica]|uniref:Cytoplasmic tRNA 2-thiolation protein 1 n=1 Tax=Saxophila tyrrhenica TaxID=1690608 RepID=A0AAV9PJU1_9PEZI|nr:cytosolic thiouridylase subunit Ctu1 [Saxophila tyrrhenica]